MINLAVINLKDIINIIKKLLIVFFIILFIKKSYQIIKKNNIYNIIYSNDFYNKILDSEIIISKYSDVKKNRTKKNSGIRRLLGTELSIINVENDLIEKEDLDEIVDLNDVSQDKDESYYNEINAQNTNEFIDLNNSLEIIDSKNIDILNNLPNHIDGKVIQSNNKKDTFTNIYNSVKIKNESSYELTNEMMIPNVEFENKKDIIIYHTHTCESYTPTNENNYIASGNFRTTDLNYSVSRVGDELSNYLQSKNFNVIHNKNIHDYPAYTGSYSRSLLTINEITSNNPNLELIIDLHRDALSNSSYGPKIKFGDEVVSQLMFVIGTDGGGLDHPNWLNNFKLAIKIQEKANEMYPGLFKPIILRNSRYNQHVAKGAFIIEVGATGNTIEECNASMKYFAKVIEEIMK